MPLPPLHEQAYRWRRTAHAHLGGGQLRRFQGEVLAHTLLRRDMFVLAPTGLGKSLAFQLPGLAEPGLRVVISPLRALLTSQVADLQVALDALGGEGRALHGLRNELFAPQAVWRASRLGWYCHPVHISCRTWIAACRGSTSSGVLGRRRLQARSSSVFAVLFWHRRRHALTCLSVWLKVHMIRSMYTLQL